MKIIPLTYQILLSILKKECSFQTSLKKHFNLYQITPNNKVDATITICGELRHHLLLSNFILNKVGELPIEIEAGICLLFSNKIYTKKFSNVEVEKYVKALLIDFTEELKNKIFNVYNECQEKTDVKIEQVSKPIQYLSMRFNLPSWVVKLWGNHFGRNTAFKMMKVCHSPMKHFVSFYDDNVDINNETFKNTSINRLYLYTGKGNGHNSEEFKNHWVYENNPAFIDIFESIDIEPIRGLAIYSAYSTPLIDELYKRFGHHIDADFIVSGITNLNEINRQKEDKLLNGIHTYDCPFDAITTCVSRKVNTFFVCPRSSNLNKLHTSLDFFLTVDNNKIDEYINEERTLLEKASNLIEYSGKIIYVIPTANKKESSLVIEDFLKKHPNFSLLKERQFLFDDEFDIAYYYAILEKVREND